MIHAPRLRSRAGTILVSTLVASGVGLVAACGSPPSGGAVATTTAPISGGKVTLPAGNLVQNPSFEVNLDGWYEWQGTATRVHRSDAPNGHYVAEVTYGGSGSMYSLGDSTALVASIPAGATYRGSAYVRAGSSSAVGKPVTLILRERTPEGTVARLWSSAPTDLDSTFQELTVFASAPTAGHVLDLYFWQ
jgi:hypothetical protein